MKSQILSFKIKTKIKTRALIGPFGIYAGKQIKIQNKFLRDFFFVMK